METPAVSALSRLSAVLLSTTTGCFWWRCCWLSLRCGSARTCPWSISRSTRARSQRCSRFSPATACLPTPSRSTGSPRICSATCCCTRYRWCCRSRWRRSSFVSLAVVSVPVLTGRFLRAAGADERWKWLAIPGGFSFAFYWGFLSFIVAVPFALQFLILTIRFCSNPSPRRALGIAAFSVLPFFCHIIVLGFASLVALGYVWAALVGRACEALILRVLPYATPLPLIAVWLFITYSNEAIVQERPGRVRLRDRSGHGVADPAIGHGLLQSGHRLPGYQFDRAVPLFHRRAFQSAARNAGCRSRWDCWSFSSRLTMCSAPPISISDWASSWYRSGFSRGILRYSTCAGSSGWPWARWSSGP